MKKFSKKGVLLFAAAMALCAFAMPSMASALSWDPLGTTQTITSTNVGFRSHLAPGAVVDSSCTNSSFDVDVVNATTLEVTNATFGGHCTATLNGAGLCTVNSSGTRFPWTITAASTSNIRLDNVHVDVTFTQTAGNTCPAALAGQRSTITGSTTGNGVWLPATDQLELNDVPGLVSHSSAGTSSAITVRGTFIDSVAPRLDLTD